MFRAAIPVVGRIIVSTLPSLSRLVLTHACSTCAANTTSRARRRAVATRSVSLAWANAMRLHTTQSGTCVLLSRRKHTGAVDELLARRRAVQAQFDAGQKPHFLPQTRAVRLLPSSPSHSSSRGPAATGAAAPLVDSLDCRSEWLRLERCCAGRLPQMPLQAPPCNPRKNLSRLAASRESTAPSSIEQPPLQRRDLETRGWALCVK